MDDFKFEISHPTERALAKTILQLPESIEDASKTLMVNRLTDQLYDISQKVSDQYHACKVIGTEEQNSRVALLVATKKVMEVCFDLLGMQTIQRLWEDII